MARSSRENKNDRPAATNPPAGKGRGGTSRRPAAAAPRARPPIIMATCTRRLLQAAERVLERDGLAGLTLRAVAREAGVSHAAPTHHFGDLTGLVQRTRRDRLPACSTSAMVAARASETHPMMKAMATAKAYVAYAQAHPGMYGLMFRNERLDMTRPSLHEAADGLIPGAGELGRRRPPASGEALEALSLDQAAAIARNWSLVHGFTMLLLDGRLADILHRLPAGTTPEQLLDAMMSCGRRAASGRRA